MTKFPKYRSRYKFLLTVVHMAVLGFFLAPTAQATITSFDAVETLPLSIPDNNPAGRTVTVNVSGITGTVNSLTVTILFGPDHTYAGNLAASLRSPAGVTHILFSRVGYPDMPGGDSSNLRGRYTFSDLAAITFWQATLNGATTSSIIPAGTYSTTAPGVNAATSINQTFGFPGTVNGSNVNGIWTFNIADLEAFDTGGINQVTLNFDHTPGPANAAPSINAMSGIGRQAGGGGSVSHIALVSDDRDAAEFLNLKVNGGSSATVNGVSVSNLLTDQNGNVNAAVWAACGASNASFTLTATDSSGLSSSSILNVGVTSPAPPNISYGPVSVVYGGSGNVSPIASTASSFSISSLGTYNGSADVDASGTLTLSNARNAGSHELMVRGIGLCGVFTDSTLTVNVSPATLNVSPDNKTKQYSDPAPSLTYSLTGFVEGDDASAVNGSPELTTVANELSEPGTYPITAAAGNLSAANYVFNFGSADLNVVPEDARAEYTGSRFVNTGCATCNSAAIDLSALVSDISLWPTDAAFDTDAGNIGTASISFVDRETGAVIAELPVSLLSNDDLRIGNASFWWTVDLGEMDSKTFTVGMIVGGNYLRNSTLDDVLITVSKPTGANSISGGGAIMMSDPAGQFQADPGSRLNFSLNVKYLPNGRNLKGYVRFTISIGGRQIEFRSNRNDSLVVDVSDPKNRTAELTGRGSITDVTDPDNPLLLYSNAAIFTRATDREKAGDSIAFTVTSSNGLLLFSSNWVGTQSSERTIKNGHLIVR